MAIDINIPSQVKNYANLAGFPATGTLKTIFIAEDTNKTYRWTGSAYVEISPAGASGVTIGTTAITSGTVGSVLFEGTGNVVSESANITYDNTNVLFALGSTATRILNFRPQDTTGAYGNSCSIRGGISNGRLDFYSASNITELKDNIIILTSVGGPSIQVGASSISLSVASATRLQVAPTTGNILIGTTTDAGYKLDVNGNTRSSRFYATDGITVGRISFDGFNNNTGIDYNSTTNLFRLFAAAGLNFLSAGFNLDTIIQPVRNTVDNIGDVVINGGGSERARFKANGNVGIGTSSPSNKLDISGNATGGNPTRLGITNTGASGVADLFAFNDTGRFLGLQMFGSTATSTFAGINNANLAKFVTNNTFVVGTSGSNPLVFAVNGSVLTGEVARFSTNSNFLINTTTDAGYKLDVNGTARVSGQISSGITGTNGNVGIRRTADGGIVGSFYTDGTQTIVKEHTGTGGVLLNGFDTTSLKWMGNSSQPRVGIGFNGTISATCHIKGAFATSATSSLLIENSAGTAAMRVRDDLLILLPSLPTSPTGLPTGAIWNNLGILSIV